MTDFECVKEQFNLLMAQAQYWQKTWNSRPGYEWKVTIGLWTLLVVSVAFMKEEPPVWFLIAIGIILFLLYFHWLRGLWNANEDD